MDASPARQKARLLLRFDGRDAPSADDLLAAAERAEGLSVSLPPLVGDDGRWARPLELLIDGMTFDLAPASGAGTALALVPGPHLGGGEHLMPILRRWLATGMMLGAELPALTGFHWDGSACTLSSASFASATAAWLDGGAMPAEFLIAADALGAGHVATRGLAFFTGQELELASDVAVGHDHGQRLAMRIAGQLALLPPLLTPEPMTGPDGTPLLLVPERGKVHVRRG